MVFCVTFHNVSVISLCQNRTEQNISFNEKIYIIHMHTKHIRRCQLVNICLSECMSIWVYVYLYLCLYVYVYMYVCPSISMSIFWCNCQSARLSVCMHIHVKVNLYVYLSMCLYFYLFMYASIMYVCHGVSISMYVYLHVFMCLWMYAFLNLKHGGDRDPEDTDFRNYTPGSGIVLSFFYSLQRRMNQPPHPPLRLSNKYTFTS